MGPFRGPLVPVASPLLLLRSRVVTFAETQSGSARLGIRGGGTTLRATGALNRKPLANLGRFCGRVDCAASTTPASTVVPSPPHTGCRARRCVVGLRGGGVRRRWVRVAGAQTGPGSRDQDSAYDLGVSASGDEEEAEAARLLSQALEGVNDEAARRRVEDSFRRLEEARRRRTQRRRGVPCAAAPSLDAADRPEPMDIHQQEKGSDSPSGWVSAIEIGVRTALIVVAMGGFGALSAAGRAEATAPQPSAAVVSTVVDEAAAIVNDAANAANAGEPLGEAHLASATLSSDQQRSMREKLRYQNPIDQQSPKLLSPEYQPKNLLGAFFYKMDLMFETYPISSIVVLVIITGAWVFFGAVVWYIMALNGLKRTALGKKPTFGNCLWASWSCVAASSTHTKESHIYGRALAFALTMGGLLSYSILCGTVSATMRQRLVTLQSGRGARTVQESGHVVVVGKNSHLGSLLRQLDRSRMYARLDGRASSKKQTVILISPDTNGSTKTVNFDYPELKVLLRHGDLSSKETFARSAVQHADTVVLLSDHNDAHTADSNALSSLLAVTAGKEFMEKGAHVPKIVVEVSKESSARLMQSVSGVINFDPVVDMTNRLLAQCMRQTGLTKIYRKLMRHTGTIINLRNYPEIANLPMREIRQGFTDAVVCGIIKDGKVHFHPPDSEIYRATDFIMLIANKNTHREPPAHLVKLAKQVQAGLQLEPERLKLVVPEYGLRDKSVLTDDCYHIVDANGNEVSGGGKAGRDKAARTFYSTNKKDLEKRWQENLKSQEKVERIVMCGWRVGVAETCFELDQVVPKNCEMVILAETPIAEREKVLQRKIISYGRSQMNNLKIVHVEGNPCSRTDVQQAILMETKRGKVPKDVSIVVVAEGNVQQYGSKSDKRSIFCALMAEDICKEHNISPRSLVAEIVDRRLGQQVRKTRKHFGYISTMELMGLYISQVVEHPLLKHVWSELLRFDGSSIHIKSPGFYTRFERPVTFGELTDAAKARGETAIGWRVGGRTHLNPLKTDTKEFGPGDGIIVIATDRF